MEVILGSGHRQRLLEEEEADLMIAGDNNLEVLVAVGGM